MNKIRMKVTITGFYDADPRWYPENSSPEDMCKVDVNNGIDAILDCVDQNTLELKIEPVGE